MEAVASGGSVVPTLRNLASKSTDAEIVTNQIEELHAEARTSCHSPKEQIKLLFAQSDFARTGLFSEEAFCRVMTRVFDSDDMSLLIQLLNPYRSAENPAVIEYVSFFDSLWPEGSDVIHCTGMASKKDTSPNVAITPQELVHKATMVEYASEDNAAASTEASEGEPCSASGMEKLEMQAEQLAAKMEAKLGTPGASSSDDIEALAAETGAKVLIQELLIKFRYGSLNAE
eukprot:gnl/MRDRNA2_/MRDRNA2_165471_c0_seq1.p1 gnl/MRDRNA2_/MRDRNA2_165471_c0~~gnl/MRDRNA2_/MRDRNA2_165471_c0_seq1.p1  ORF type:complete len:230 (+),score=61.04 gnl/MRDRNA2_/MRDRNA2_165471_c0_seq1:146-835(+)